MRHYTFLLPYLAGLVSLSAQLFTGTNAPNTALDFSITVAGATNLSFSVGGSATAYSYLLIQKGTPPSDTSYDFSSRVNGQTNAVYLEAPEASDGKYYIRVRTPAASQTHAFTLQVQANRADLRASARPVTKLLGNTARGSATSGSWEYFRVELKTNLAWQINVNAGNNTVPDVYADYSPSGSAYKVPTSASPKKSVGQTNDLLAYTAAEGQPGTYSIGINGATAVGKVNYTLDVAAVNLANLTWDPGVADAGTEVFTNTSGVGGDYYFKIVTQSSSLGAWRTVLRVLTPGADANVFLKKGALPTPTTADFASALPGSDGLVLDMASSSQPIYANEVWYILVRANTGAQWTLASGAAFVTDLGSIAVDGGSGSGNVTIGPEGMRFFGATVPSEALAWRLWLNGQTNLIRLRKGSLPLPNAKDQEQAGQMLVVNPYLNAGQYFIAVPGAPDSSFNLDSRQQPILDLPYGASLITNITGYGYATYRVAVPTGQIAWRIYLPSTSGNPNLSVRQGLVPNESYNNAYSELAGNVPDNVTLVWPALSSGTFYITVYQTNLLTTNANFTLENGPAPITDIHYSTVVTNDDPTRVGWRFYRVSDLSEQQYSLGWDLFLTNFTPGTRIALRRNQAPGLWNFRNPSPAPIAYYDLLSAGDFLQHVDHQPDTWYVGVYNPSNALGAFTLTARELLAENIADNTPTSRTNALNGRWEFFRIQLNPEDLQEGASGAVVGWDLRLDNVTSGQPRLVVRRDRYPTNLNTTITTGGKTWGSTLQWAAAGDWTRRTFSEDGVTNEDGRILVMPVGRPLEAGSYYIGVLNDSKDTNVMSYSLLSRWIGRNRAIPVADLNWTGDCLTNTLNPREAAYYRVIVPPAAPSWKVRLRTLAGEAMFLESTNFVPGVNPADSKGMQKTGAEQYVRLPASGSTSLLPGTNFIAVIGEGVDPAATNCIGSGQSTFALESFGPMPEFNLGTLTTTDVITNGSLEGGACVAYHVRASEGVIGFYILLTNQTGFPCVVSRPGLAVPDPGVRFINPQPDTYGNEGGELGNLLISSSTGAWVMADGSPAQDYTIVIKARQLAGGYPDASYTLHLQPITAQVVEFNDSTNQVFTDPRLFGNFYKVQVPPEAKGWDLRLTDVISGSPVLIVSRHILPYASSGGYLVTTGFLPNPFNATNWPNLAMWIADTDWTARYFSADGSVDESGQILAMGMGRPLEPGWYYVTVMDTDGDPADCKLVSRGIGPGFGIPVTDLDFYTGQVTNTLPPREAAYFHVVIPAGVSSWKVQLSPTLGEAMLVASKDSLPNVGAGQSASQGWSVLNSGGRKMQKIGDEQFLLLPPAGQDYLLPGDYYLAVVSEGQLPADALSIGSGASTFTLKSLGAPAPVNFGTVGPAPNELVETNSLQGGETRLYQFTVASGTQILEARLDRWSGNPVMSLRAGSRAPDPGASYSPLPVDTYGNDGGEAPGANVASTLLTIPTPTNGVYSVAVKARSSSSSFSPGQSISNALYTLRVSAKNPAAIVLSPVEFESVTSVTNQPAGWYYFSLDVPTNALGWDVRLANVTSGSPRLVVRRDNWPTTTTTTSGWSPNQQSSWPSNYQWAANLDWTGRKNSADGLDESGRVMAMGMGHPLQPGTYFIGVTNANVTNASYTLLSRGIGDSNFFSIPVLDLPFVGALTNWALRPREAAYYRVIVPSNSPSWQFDVIGLTNVGGEFLVSAYRNALPTSETTDDNGTLPIGKRMKRPGDEHYVQLPTPGVTSVLPGTNFIAVVGEGQNPVGTQNIGAGNSGYILTSGELPATDLGLLTSDDLVLPDALGSGDVAAYQFTVSPWTYGAKLRLENRSGRPVMIVRQGTRFVDPGAIVAGLAADKYGNDGGEIPVAADGNTNMLTLPNPFPDTYTIVVKARPISSTTFSDARYTLRVQEILAPELNFTSDQNFNGLTNGVAGTLEDNERAFFKFQIPDGQLGWRLKLSQTSGQASLRVYQGALPSDLNPNQMPFTNGTIVIAPPYLTAGEWFVEVKGAGSTTYSLLSSALTLVRPAWVMPSPGDTNSTPGLVLPTFADTGVETNGTSLPGDGSIFLAQGDLNYYAVVVSGTNQGLLSATLQVMNGNPELYLRAGAVPTINHNPSGGPGVVYDRSLSGSTNTMYASWVPLNGKAETQLAPGLWYLAVRAGGNLSANYKLSLALGKIIDLPLDGSTLTNQVILGDGDWLYYRLVMPTALPLSFSVTLRQDYGSVIMHLRDTVPPGTGTNRTAAANRDWATDLKNFGPYSNNLSAGTYTFSAPVVRPGQILYLGLRSATHSAFSISAATNGAPVQEPTVVPFYGGSVLTNVPPFSAVLFRIDVPSEATRWKHSATHPTNLLVYLDQGTLPLPVLSPVRYCWKSSAANSTLNTPLAVWDDTEKLSVPKQVDPYVRTKWPWITGQSYFMVVTNTTAVPQDFALLMDGRNAILDGDNAHPDDNDGNGLPDLWELTYFSTNGVAPGADADHDGFSNLEEFQARTSPTDSTSYRAHLLISAVYGTVARDPDEASYALGSYVVLTPVPAAGYSFIGWGGSASGTNNPLTLLMDTHKTITATFKLAGDNFATALPLSGASAIVAASNVGFTKEPGEPYHAGNPGGKSIWWRWTAPASGPVTLSTAGSTFNTLLAAYTGTVVSNLNCVGSDNNSTGGTNRSRVTFNAQSGTTYSIAVDGVNGASSKIALSLALSSAPVRPLLAQMACLPNATAQFVLSGEANQTYVVEVSSDLVSWTTLGSVTTSTSGTCTVSDTGTLGLARRFYRARLP